MIERSGIPEDPQEELRVSTDMTLGSVSPENGLNVRKETDKRDEDPMWSTESPALSHWFIESE